MSFAVLLDRLRFWLTAAMAFALPLNFLAVAILAGISLVVCIARLLVAGGVKPRPAPFIFFIGFYAIHALAMLYTEHEREGLFNLQVKFSLFLFPVIYAFLPPFEPKQVRAVLWSFVAGCGIAAAVCLVSAGIDYSRTGNPEELFYTSLSFFMHPSYLSMYMVLAMLAVLYLEPFSGSTLKKILSLAVLVCLFFFIVMLQSKAGILAAMGLLALALGLEMWRRRTWKLPLLALALLAATYWATDKFIITNANSRIYNATYNITHAQPVVTNSAETSEVRMNIWRTVKEILPGHWLAGVGTGDAKYVLLDAYKARGMSYAAEHVLNAHNQYLQTWLMTGIAGLLLLLASFAWPLIAGLRRRRSLYVFFLLLFGLNLMAEAMLEGQAGTLFYGFFNAFFCFAATKWSDASTQLKI